VCSGAIEIAVQDAQLREIHHEHRASTDVARGRKRAPRGEAARDDGVWPQALDLSRGPDVEHGTSREVGAVVAIGLSAREGADGEVDGRRRRTDPHIVTATIRVGESCDERVVGGEQDHRGNVTRARHAVSPQSRHVFSATGIVC